MGAINARRSSGASEISSHGSAADQKACGFPNARPDDESLDALAEHGITFTILAESSEARAGARRQWVAGRQGRVDPSRRYLIRLSSGRTISQCPARRRTNHDYVHRHPQRRRLLLWRVASRRPQLELRSPLHRRLRTAVDGDAPGVRAGRFSSDCPDDGSLFFVPASIRSRACMSCSPGSRSRARSMKTSAP